MDFAFNKDALFPKTLDCPRFLFQPDEVVDVEDWIQTQVRRYSDYLNKWEQLQQVQYLEMRHDYATTIEKPSLPKSDILTLISIKAGMKVQWPSMPVGQAAVTAAMARLSIEDDKRVRRSCSLNYHALFG